jgi:YYY domain-containing protein
MLATLTFWIVAAGVGIVALPLAELLLGRLPGRGLVFARALGLLAVVFPAWVVASVGIAPFGVATVVASVALLVVGCGALRIRGIGRVGAASPARAVWLTGEIVFTVAFFGWAILRSFSPDVWNTEKPMDMAFINAIGRSEWFPPHDPWQSGSDVNYYYYGHYLVAFLVRLTGIEPAVAFNLAVALFYALVATSVFGVAATLYEAARREADAPSRSPVLVGLTAVGLAALVGNLAGGAQLLQEPGRLGDYDWWSPSRVIDGTANEFPWFSFLLGDLHAHVMVTPFTLVAVAYAIQLGLRGPPLPRASRRATAELLLASLVLGALYALNSFDFPTACGIGLGALLVWALDAPGRVVRAALWGCGWVGLAVVLYLPFWDHFSPPTTSIGRIHERTSFTSFARDYWLIYGVFLWIVLALFAARFALARRYLAWIGAAGLFFLVLLAPDRLSGVAIVLVVVALAVFATLASGTFSLPYRLLWLLSAVAFGLVASGEVLYLRDAFDGTPSFRFNTVFKTGYQAWFLFAVVGAITMYWSASWFGRRLRAAWLAVLAILVAAALVYPIVGTYAKSAGFEHRPTLDGMRWLERTAPEDAAAIVWLRRSVDGTPTLVESVGPDFDPEGRGRVSTYTGIPSVITWPGHGRQWGHDSGTRIDDVQRLYATQDAAVARRLLDRYGVRYVFVGSLERRDYPAASLAKFRLMGNEVFRSGSTIIYDVGVPEPAAAGNTR